jgi:hypothetical protein
MTNNECFSLKQLDLNGDDLLKTGVEGAEIGTMLNITLEGVIAGFLNNNKDD